MINACGWNMWSLRQCCWTVTSRGGEALLCCERARVISFCLCAVTHVHMQQLNCQEPWRRSWETGETRGGARQDLGGARSLCNSGPPTCVCVCVGASVRQLPSACRGSGVYSSSLLLLGSARFPVAPSPTSQDRRGSATRLGLATSAFHQKLILF